MRFDFKGRLGRLREKLAKSRLDGAVLVPGPNLRYYTGVESLLLERPFMLLVPVDGEPHLVAPAIEAGPYLAAPLDMQVHSWTDSEGSAGAIRKAAESFRLGGRWGMEGRVPFLFVSRLMEAVRPKFVDAEPVFQGIREIKDREEVRLLKRSSKILSQAFGKFPDLVHEGTTEIEIARAATELIYEGGGTKVDDMLVQSGARAADAHGLPSVKKVRRGEGVIIDVGATFDGYYSDITRTYGVGVGRELEEVYSRVLEAEESAIRTAGEGVRVGDVDRSARGRLRRAGLGKYFTHRTGHGLGLEVHEAPYIIEGGKEKLLTGMCFTVEPGVYMGGKMGVRIEDNVLIEGGKGKVLTDTPKEFGWWR
jgi:Xaa-Pro dipeptidase